MMIWKLWTILVVGLVLIAAFGWWYVNGWARWERACRAQGGRVHELGTCVSPDGRIVEVQT